MQKDVSSETKRFARVLVTVISNEKIGSEQSKQNKGYSIPQVSISLFSEPMENHPQQSTN